GLCDAGTRRRLGEKNPKRSSPNPGARCAATPARVHILAARIDFGGKKKAAGKEIFPAAGKITRFRSLEGDARAEAPDPGALKLLDVARVVTAQAVELLQHRALVGDIEAVGRDRHVGSRRDRNHL